MKDMDFRGRRVIVTGASSGLGLEMAKVLACEHGATVIAVARRLERLEALAREVQGRGQGSVEPIAADLSKVHDVDRVFAEATAKGPLYGAVLNAGITHFGEHHELSWPDFEAMLATNVTGVVRLTTHVLPHLESRGEGGGILLVSSMAGLTPVPYQTAYSATKAFLVNFGCGLYHEARPRGVSITTFVPGGIQTEMTSGDRFRKLGGWLMPADKCAVEAIDCFRKRKYLHAPGIFMRAGTSLLGLIPREFLAGRVAATYRTALEAARRESSS
ncbi:MAG TPA: SDR family NAD(P)-dependent oxidoreductase [Polyangiaceae bacterium]|nr:SDR family NAD(P)-dependent oxidoreductase [Polyangiaceae bacterium]